MQVMFGPRRGPTFNNRWWNDRRSWNLRTTNSREKASPKGANRIQSCSCSPPSGTIREYLSLSAGSIPFGHSTSGYSHSPPSGTADMSFRHFPIFRGLSHLPLSKLEFMIFSSSLFAFQKICKSLRNLTEIIW